MIVNIYLDEKGNILDILADETTSHRLGDIIHLKGEDGQRIISSITSREQYDYNIITYVNKVVKSNNIVDDTIKLYLEGDINEVQTNR